MEIKTMTVEEEEEYRSVLHEYYGLLYSLQKRFDLREYMHSDVQNGATIRIIHKINRHQEKIAASASADSSTDAMRIAIRDLENFRDQNRT